MSAKTDTVAEVVPVVPLDLDSVSTPTLAVPTTNPAPEASKATERVLPNEEDLRLALQIGILKRGPVHDMVGRQSALRQKCSTCGQSKTAHQPWEDHNCSEGHITNLINKRGFSSAIAYLDRECSKFLTVKCDL